MSGAAAALSPPKGAESPLSGVVVKKRDSLGSAPSHPILKGYLPSAVLKDLESYDVENPVNCRELQMYLSKLDVGEIYSRLLDHRPVIQGEMRYFIKEFEEKRGLREVRVLENLKNTVSEANDQTLPKCEEVMHGSLNELSMRLQAAVEIINRMQQREQEERQLHTEKLVAGEKQRVALWEEFMKERLSMKAVVDEEHTKAMERVKEQYATLEKDLAKNVI